MPNNFFNKKLIGSFKQSAGSTGFNQDINLDTTFITSQVTSFIANKFGQGYGEVVIYNILILAMVKGALVLIKKNSVKKIPKNQVKIDF